MVKVFGPMMSLDASGALADSVVFSKWKGRNYVRERVIPANPRSGAQVGRRAMFTFLTQRWDGLADADKASWQDFADELVASQFNAYLSQNMKGWHNYLAPSTAWPPARVFLPSDNAISSAEWVENRISLEIRGTSLNNSWGIMIFASLTASFTPVVGNTILVNLDDTVDTHYFYWTPPSVATWYFNSMTFAYDGAKAADFGGETSASAP